MYVDKNSEMESKNKQTTCRLCLCENECFINIFEMNDWKGFIVAEVISDLLQFQVSRTDCYPHVVCSTCLDKLNDFMLFKEFCQKSMITYDKIFILRDGLELHQLEMDICHGGSELQEEDPLRDTSSNDERIEFQTSKCSSATVDPTPPNDEAISSDLIASCTTVKNEPLEVEEFEFQESNQLSKAVIGISTNSMELSDDFESEITIKEEPLLVQFTAVDAVAHSHYPQCLEHDRPKITSKGSVDVDLCARNITTNDESVFDNSKNISLNVNIEASSSGKVERLEGQWISPGERMNMAPFNQEDIVLSLEVGGGKKEKVMGAEREEGRGTAPEKGFEGERKQLECFHCGSMLMTKSSLIKHMMLHGFGNTYDCDVCGKTYKRKHCLKRHVPIHTDSKPFECEECGKLYSYNSGLQRHMRLHTEPKWYKCSECSECFSKKGTLKVHMKLHTGSKPYKCVECSKCFSYNSYLILHMRTHTGSKPYTCVVCSKKFRYFGNLTQHMIIHTGLKPYKCTDCSKCFTQKSGLKNHIRSHTGYKPYKCAECSKCFRGNSDLKVHMRIHTGFKPFKCGTCSKGFTNSSDLKKHLLVHTKEKPFECHTCGTRFRQRRSLKIHLEKRCKVGIE